jgi:methionine-rich copper-binding protein CopC
MLPATVAATSRILIYNTAGAVVYTGKTSIEKGNNQISLPLQSSLPAGTYVLKAATGTSTQTILFVKR